jgi:ribonuclease J
LIQKGADVIYDPLLPVHVSGHAAQEEMKLLINLVKPRYFVPVHGELRQLTMHKKLAMQLGIPEENTAIVENGTILTFTSDSMSIGERVPGGYVFVDGSGVGDIGPTVMREREMLGRDGFVIINITLDSHSHELMEEPDILSRGFVYLPEAGDLVTEAQRHIRRAVDSTFDSTPRELRTAVEDTVERFLYTETKRRPMVFVFIHEVVR